MLSKNRITKHGKTHEDVWDLKLKNSLEIIKHQLMVQKLSELAPCLKNNLRDVRFESFFHLQEILRSLRSILEVWSNLSIPKIHSDICKDTLAKKTVFNLRLTEI